MKRFGFFICFAIMMANTVSAQALKTYEGAMKLPSELEYLRGIFSSCYSEYNCKGSYQYYDGDDGERVRHGDFNSISMPPIGTHNFGLTGQYNHGKMDGEWIAARINNKGEMILPSWGKDYMSMFLINYKEGTISGRYELIDGSNGGMYITHYTGNIENGIIQGNVSVRKIQNKVITDITLADTCTMTGEVGADGMPIGVWTVTDKGDIDKIQRRFFHKGVLVAIDEMDSSTGERKLCYCAFEGLKKAPKMEEIKDSISGADSYIVYNGQSAIKVKDDNSIRYNSNLGRYSLGNNGINVVVPEEIKQLSKSVNQQIEMWMYVYSEKN